MKLVSQTGCTSWGIDIDDKDFNEYSKEEIRGIAKKIIDNTEDQDLFSLLETLIGTYGKYEDLGQCDQCFDYVSRFTLNI